MELRCLAAFSAIYDIDHSKRPPPPALKGHVVENGSSNEPRAGGRALVAWRHSLHRVGSWYTWSQCKDPRRIVTWDHSATKSSDTKNAIPLQQTSFVIFMFRSLH